MRAGRRGRRGAQGLLALSIAAGGDAPGSRAGRGRHLLAPGLLALALLAGASGTTAQEEEVAPERVYDVVFEARLLPTEQIARASITVGAGASHLRWLRFRADPQRYSGWKGDGEVNVDGDVVTWTPPPTGGRLRYVFRVDHLRTPSSYDARCAENWALFRGGDLFPPARVRSAVGARSRSRLRLRVPEGWSVVVPYRRAGLFYEIEDGRRAFDRPTGWMIVGELGVLRERVAGVRVAVAGPVGQGVRRHDMLALLRWTLPALRDAVGTLPDRILVVSAADPMWRGGLSAPRSVFVHSDRPLISADLTSPLLHELIHALMRARAGPRGDWIAEGLAELYSLELLVRSKTVSRRRYEKALARMAERGRKARDWLEAPAEGPVAARAVTVLHELDRAIQDETEGRVRLDQVLAWLSAHPAPVTPALLRAAVSETVGSPLDEFFRARGLSGK